MLDAIKEIVVALIEQKQIANTSDVDKNIEEVNKAINEIGKNIYKINHTDFD